MLIRCFLFGAFGVGTVYEDCGIGMETRSIQDSGAFRWKKGERRKKKKKGLNASFIAGVLGLRAIVFRATRAKIGILRYTFRWRCMLMIPSYMDL